MFQVLKDLGEVVIVDLEDKTLQSAHNDVVDIPSEVRAVFFKFWKQGTSCVYVSCLGGYISEKSIEKLVGHGWFNVEEFSSS